MPEQLNEYYGRPLLKAPVWTWEVPAYFFVGGAAGAAALVGAVARRTGAAEALVRDARWVAAAGSVMSPPLLISDLGRPDRFLNMLRVFKLRSPMSVGAWTLVAFSNAAAAAAFADRSRAATGDRIPVRIVGDAAELLSAATGLMLSTYTGVLLGATAIPVWSRHATLLPAHFGASSLGSAVGILELLGHRQRALNRLGLAAAMVETALALHLELDDDPTANAVRRGHIGWLARGAGVLSGPAPLLLRLLGERFHAARPAAALSALIGSLLSRVAWVAAGKASARGAHAIATSSPRTDLPPA